MAKLGINTGTAANAGDGSALRAGGNIINANFDEIYEYFGDGTTLDADLAGKWLAVATGINTLSNIGIGTTNPWNALTVLGNASITGVTTSSGGFSGDITGTVTGNVYNTGISTFQDVLVSGASTVTGKSTFTGIGTFSSDLYVGGNLYTLGDITYDEVNGRNISVTGIGTVAYLGVTDINVSGFSTFSGLSTTGSDLYIGDSLYVSQDATVTGVVTANNVRVGVVTSTASTAGDDFIIEGDSDRGMSIISGNQSSANIFFGDGDDTNRARVVYQQTDESLDFHTNGSATAALRINSTGNIGINSQSPSVKLDVVGNANFSGVVTANTARVGVITSTAPAAGDDFIIEGDSDRGMSIISGNQSSANIFFGDGDDTNRARVVYQQTDESLDFHTNGSATAALRINSTGKIGIDSQSPRSTLDVNGSINVGSNGSVGISTTAVTLADSVELRVGSLSGGDAKIYHNGTETKFSNSTGQLEIISDDLELRSSSGVSTYLSATAGAGSTIHLGDVTKGYDVTILGSNNFFYPPALTNAERGNCTTMRDGALIYNSESQRLELYSGGQWRAISQT